MLSPSNSQKNNIKTDLNDFVQNINSQNDINTRRMLHPNEPSPSQQQQMLQPQQQVSNGSAQNSLDEFSNFPVGMTNSIFPPFNHIMSLQNESDFMGFPTGRVDDTLSTSSGANSPYSNADSVAAPSSINSTCGGGNGNGGALNNGSCSGTSSSTNGSGLIIKKSKKDKPVIENLK